MPKFLDYDGLKTVVENIPKDLATPEKDGLLSAKDKAKLDSMVSAKFSDNNTLLFGVSSASVEDGTLIIG